MGVHVFQISKDQTMTKKKIDVAPKTTTVALATLPDAKLAPLFGSPLALQKLQGSGGNVTREEGVTLVTGRAYATRDRTVPASEVFFVPGGKPSVDGPWLGEADKLSWRDEETGLECIMLRDTHGGHLCGYVGVPQGHPLWGWDHEAVPATVGIEVHGGLTYSQICAEGPRPVRRLVAEARRICHVPPSAVRYMPLQHATDHRPGDAHAWWFGFSCDHVYDVVPSDRQDRARFLGAETAAEYRDDAYVVREILNLARQLRAIADGAPVPPREGPPLPAFGLDPKKGA